MKTARIDLVGQNGNDGLHYKYEEVTNKIVELADDYRLNFIGYYSFKNELIKILVENFPDD